MKSIVEKLVPWGPVFFGGLIFSQMWSAALGVSLPITVAVGVVWGCVAVKGGRW